MKFSKYLSSLLPSFSRDQLMEDLDTIGDELRVHVIPPYQVAVKEFGKNPFYSNDAQKADEVFNKRLNEKYKGNHLTGVLNALENSDSIIKLLQTMIDEEFAIDVTSAGLSTLRVNIMQLVEILGFTVRYARRHLNYILVCESCHHSGKQVTDSFSTGELDWLREGRDAFINGINVLSMPKRDVEVKFKEIPNVLVTDESIETTQQLLGKDKTDPFQMRFIPLVLNPIYHVRIRVAEYQAAKYREAKEERNILELRIMLLKEQREGRENAKIEKQIEYNEGRLQKIVYKLEKAGGQDEY